MCVRSLHDPSVLTICQSILMPPPAKPSSIKFPRRSFQQLENGQRSSPFFSRAIQDGGLRTALRAPEKQEAEPDDEANKPSILPAQAISTNKRQNKDNLENILAQCEAKKPANSSVMQVVGGGHENMSQVVTSSHHQRLQGKRIDLDYDERKLYDRVSREKAGMFRSAKSYRQSVEKRRRLG